MIMTYIYNCILNLKSIIFENNGENIAMITFVFQND